MLLSERATAEDILEVWYSSTWSEPTLNSFRRALSRALDEAERCRDLGPLRRLTQWRAEVEIFACATTLQAKANHAYHHWYETQVKSDPEQNTFEIGSFLEESDRIAACLYTATGEVIAKSRQNTSTLEESSEWTRKSKFANVTMLSNDQNDCATIFDLLPVQRVLESKAKNGNCNIVDAIVACLLDDIRILKDRVTSKKVVIMTPLRAQVSLEDSDVLKYIYCIAGIPRTMSWSNVVDYIRYCSREK
ncbi:unnamed protein product [Amoebophrya sp. A25]|nr:unnamed protein product [Amoebophrya sp. A25]|eukprot:GSA25T00016947001.1